MIHYAAIGAFDAAVLVSGDDDFVPAVEAVNALGKQVWVATWSADELSKDLRVRCFGHIHLSDGVSAFRAERRPYERGLGRATPARPARPVASPVSSSQVERGLQELQRAEARLPHVGRGYFVMRWKSHALPPAGAGRAAPSLARRTWTDWLQTVTRARNGRRLSRQKIASPVATRTSTTIA